MATGAPTTVPTLPKLTADPASQAFADRLVQCIQDNARAAADSLHAWASVCLPPTEKIDIQAAVLEQNLPAIQSKYGYSAALWCAFYSVRMTGAEYDPNDVQPNNPNYPNWYATLVGRDSPAPHPSLLPRPSSAPRSPHPRRATCV